MFLVNVKMALCVELRQMKTSCFYTASPLCNLPLTGSSRYWNRVIMI